VHKTIDKLKKSDAHKRYQDVFTARCEPINETMNTTYWLYKRNNENC